MTRQPELYPGYEFYLILTIWKVVLDDLDNMT